MKTSVKLLDLVSKNLVRKNNAKSTNDYIVEIFLQDLSQEYTRIELIVEITKLRYQDANNTKYTNEELDKLITTNAEVAQELTKLAKTVKNALDQSVSNAQNNSSFNNNLAYNQDYKLMLNNNKVSLKALKVANANANKK